MKPGHPFETEQLDELRAEQRRTLRFIPRAVLAEAAPRVGPDLDSTPAEDRPLVEALLRAEAKELLGSREIARLVESWRQPAQVEALHEFYQRNQARAEQLAVGPQAAFFDQAELARNAHRDAAPAAVVPVELAPRVRRLLLTLVWADHLAGYRDPRLDGLPASGPPPPADAALYEVPPPPGVDRPSRSGDTTEFEPVTEDAPT